MPYLALILFVPWFCLLGALFWFYPRQPRTVRRKAIDVLVLVFAFALSFAGMQLGYTMGLADARAGAIWKQVLATLVAYGAFLSVMVLAVPVRAWLLGRAPGR